MQSNKRTVLIGLGILAIVVGLAVWGGILLIVATTADDVPMLAVTGGTGLVCLLPFVVGGIFLIILGLAQKKPGQDT